MMINSQNRKARLLSIKLISTLEYTSAASFSVIIGHLINFTQKVAQCKGWRHK